MDPKKPNGMAANGGSPPSKQAAPPDWADGLKKLYDSVVDEPLPDSFKDLLDKLDDDPKEGERQ